jgi:sugar phosphate isomerase/epimerase
MPKSWNCNEGEYMMDKCLNRSEQTAKMPERREFLKSAVALGAGMAASAKWALPGSKTPGAKRVLVSAQCWVYAAPLPGHDYTPILDQIFSDLKYAGIDTFELMDVAMRQPNAVERIGELSQKYSLPVLGSSFEGAMWDRTKHSAILEDAELVITRVAKLGGRTLGTSVGRTPAPKTEEQLDAQAEVLRKIITLGKSHGVVLNLHNHTYEVQNGLHDLKGTLARIPDVKLGPDLNWLLRGGVDPLDFIHTYGKQMVFMHIRDQKADGTWPEAVGEGTMDYAGMAKALHAIPFKGDAGIELAYERGFQPTRPLRENWKISREFVRKTMGY